MEEPVTKTLFVPLQSMGRLIGKRGAGLVRLRRTSGIRNIEILPDTIDDTRQIEIKGKPATIEKATVYVMDLIGESLSEKVRPERTSSSSTSSTAEPTTQFRRCNLSHAFQSPHIEKALNIQRTIKVHWEHLDSNLSFESVVNTPGVEAMYIHVSPINGMRDVLLIGGSAPVQLALDTITERVLLEDTTGTHLEVSQERELSHYVRTKKTCSEAASFHSSAKISTLSIGKLIGKKGTNVQRIADVTGVDIIVYKQPSDDLREVHLFGDLKSVEKAESAIQRNVAGVRRDESRKDQPLEKTTKKIVSVPVACVGELIGRQGANLKILIQESGVKTVKVGREVTDGMRKVTIVGDPPNIDKVLKQLEKFTQVLDTTLGSSFDTQSKTEQLESLHWPDSPPREIQLSDNHLLHFLHAQSACLKCSVEEFYQWLQSEDIDTLKDLVEAFSDPDFVRKDMQDHGLKGYKRSLFQKAAESSVLEIGASSFIDVSGLLNDFAFPRSVPQELECPLSNKLMVDDPVLASDGVIYERSAIEDWIARSHAEDGEVHSPVSEQVLTDFTLIPMPITRASARECASSQQLLP